MKKLLMKIALGILMVICVAWVGVALIVAFVVCICFLPIIMIISAIIAPRKDRTYILLH